MVAPSYRAGAEASAFKTGSPTVTMTKPTGAVSGDVLQAAFFTNDSSRTLNTLPDGWSLLINIGSATTPGGRLWVCKKVAGASEPASYDFVFNYSFNGSAAIWADEAASDVSVVGAGDVSAVLSNPYEVLASGITTPDNDSLLVWVGALRFTTDGTKPVPTAPSGFDARIDVSSQYWEMALAVADKAQATAGASGDATGSFANATGGDGRGFGVLLAISPSGGGSTVTASGEPALPIITSVGLDDTSVGVVAGNYGDVVATVKDQDGATIQYLTGTHTSASESIATVSQLAATDSSGNATIRVTGVAPGSTTITVDFDGVQRTIDVTVANVSRPSVLISPVSATVDISETTTFTVTSEDGTTPTVVWTVPVGGGYVADGVYTAPGVAGSATVRAALASDTSQYAEATVTINDVTAYGTATVTLRRSGSALANTNLDYWVIDSDDDVIASGSGTTDADGVLAISVDVAYVGETVNVVLNNLGSDMSTAGKIHQQKVVTVT